MCFCLKCSHIQSTVFNVEIDMGERETKTKLKLRLISHPKHISPVQAPTFLYDPADLSSLQLSPSLSQEHVSHCEFRLWLKKFKVLTNKECPLGPPG